ncbi:preprotein translocase subunit YajC [Sulfurimonas sp. SAG-AH-194-C21]|nr:preprotein translocase subunit YajC [Sulfurimonas sp. SAG-AH-194-C21]MDF1882646.1 preprotein translocase subunit YajC [Sulfurimonas sp. SAG-AH-194-C21]
MDIISQILPFVFLIAVMYFVIIRPQQNEAKAKKAMLEALKKGDKVITTSGFIVVVHKVEENFLSVKLNDDTITKMTKDAVAKKFEDEA